MWWSVTPTFIEEDKDCVVSLDKKTSALYINKHMGSSLLYPRLDSDILIFMILCVCVVLCFMSKKKKHDQRCNGTRGWHGSRSVSTAGGVSPVRAATATCFARNHRFSATPTNFLTTQRFYFIFLSTYLLQK